jgi:hypothetical protein
MNELEISNVSKIGEPSASIITVASKLPPRDLAKVENDLRAAIKNNPALAELCIYCKPVGKKYGRQAFATGPSIRFAEIGQQCFQKLWVNGVIDNDNKRIMATVVCFDLLTLNVYYGTCSKSIIGRNGMYSPSMVETTSNAAFSIARRNALLQAMRPQIEACMADAQNAAIKKWCKGDVANADEATRALAVDYTRRWGTTSDQLEKLVEEEGSPEDKLIMVIGVRNYLIDNPDAYEDVFGVKAKPQGKAGTAEPPKQTPKQKLATVMLLMEQGKLMENANEITAEYCGRIGKDIKEINEAEYDELVKLLEKELPK